MHHVFPGFIFENCKITSSISRPKINAPLISNYIREVQSKVMREERLETEMKYLSNPVSLWIKKKAFEVLSFYMLYL